MKRNKACTLIRHIKIRGDKGTQIEESKVIENAFKFKKTRPQIKEKNREDVCPRRSLVEFTEQCAHTSLRPCKRGINSQ